MIISKRNYLKKVQKELSLLGITPEILKRKTGLSQRTVSRIYQGKRSDTEPFSPSFATAKKLERVIMDQKKRTLNELF